MHVTTHYQAEKIVDHFGDGGSFGVNIEYLKEETPLGTGGALGLLEKPTEPVLVINGDVLTHVDFRAMFAFHKDHGAEMTVCVRRYAVQVPYGVVECEGGYVHGLKEKPSLSFFVNAGIYLLEPTVFDLIPGGEHLKHLNMTDLAERLIGSWAHGGQLSGLRILAGHRAARRLSQSPERRGGRTLAAPRR